MSLLALCNPLLDISASVGPEYLEKYGLKPFDAILAEEKHQPIFVDLIENHKPDFFAGGSAQNTARVAQWLIQKPKATTYLGAVGNDANAKRLSEAAAKDGVNTQYYVDEAHPTGTCAVLVCDKDRSLVTNLGAANHFSPAHLAKPEIAALIDEAKFFYVSGFFLTVSPPSALQLAKHASENDKSFMLSLSAPFICQFFSDPVNELLPYTDYVVGNEHEAMAFGAKWGFGDKIEDLPEIAKKLCALPKVNTKQSRTVIFTQGPGETLIVKDGEVQRFPVIPCPKESIVDLNGAGDAWLGGFLAYRVRKASIEQCVRAANYCANVVIQRQGCTYPEKPTFNEEVTKEKKDKKDKKEDKEGKKEKKEKKEGKDEKEEKEGKKEKDGKKDEKKDDKKDEKKEKKEKK